MVSKNEELTVSEQCRLLEVNRQTLYYKPVKMADEALEEEEYIKSKIDYEHTLHCVFGHRYYIDLVVAFHAIIPLIMRY